MMQKVAVQANIPKAIALEDSKGKKIAEVAVGKKGGINVKWNVKGFARLKYTWVGRLFGCGKDIPHKIAEAVATILEAKLDSAANPVLHERLVAQLESSSPISRFQGLAASELKSIEGFQAKLKQETDNASMIANEFVAGLNSEFKRQGLEALPLDDNSDLKDMILAELSSNPGFEEVLGNLDRDDFATALSTHQDTRSRITDLTEKISKIAAKVEPTGPEKAQQEKFIQEKEVLQSPSFIILNSILANVTEKINTQNTAVLSEVLGPATYMKAAGQFQWSPEMHQLRAHTRLLDVNKDAEAIRTQFAAFNNRIRRENAQQIPSICERVNIPEGSPIRPYILETYGKNPVGLIDMNKMELDPANPKPGLVCKVLNKDILNEAINNGRVSGNPGYKVRSFDSMQDDLQIKDKLIAFGMTSDDVEKVIKGEMMLPDKIFKLLQKPEIRIALGKPMGKKFTALIKHINRDIIFEALEARNIHLEKKEFGHMNSKLGLDSKLEKLGFTKTEIKDFQNGKSALPARLVEMLEDDKFIVHLIGSSLPDRTTSPDGLVI